MRRPARQLSKFVPPRPVRPARRDPLACPRCRSPYVQPVEAKALPGGRVWVELRCPECLLWTQGSFPQERLRELQRAQAMGRAELRAMHARAVRENMYRELQALHAGFELELIGPDDFTPPRPVVRQSRAA